MTEFIVTCKSMFANGSLKKQGETFKMDEQSALNYQTAHPHLTFERLEDHVKNSRKRNTGRQKANRKAGSRLQPGFEESGAVTASGSV